MGFPQDTMPPQAPLLFNLAASFIVDEARRLADDRKALFDKITSEIQPEDATVENTLLPIIHGENHFLARRRALRFYSSTSPSPELTDASDAAIKAHDVSDVNLFIRDDVFKLLDALKRRYGGKTPSAELDHYLNKLHHAFLVNGCALDGATRDKFQEGRNRLAETERQIILNLDKSNTGIWTSLEELEGVPADFIERQKRGEGEHAGMVWLSTKPIAIAEVMKYAKHEATRRKIYTAVQNRIPGNIPLHREIVLRRDELARLLGFPSHMAKTTMTTMVENPETVTAMLSQTKPSLVAKAQESVKELLELKIKDSGEDKDASGQLLFLWDFDYYARKLDEDKATVDFKFVKEYFETWNTLNRLMAIYEHLFDIEFEQITPERGRDILGSDVEHIIWQKDVRPFMVWDTQSRSFIGYLYFDLFPRDGKYSHAGHYSLQPGYTKPDGTRFFPSGALVMNFPPPTSTRPSLLSLNQVRSLFHEMGHGLHNLLCETHTGDLNSSGVETDFIETPSIMLEYFFWTARHVQDVSQHYSRISPAYAEMWRSLNPDRQLPREKLSDDTIAALLSINQAKKPIPRLRQLHFAMYDIMVHNPASHEALKAANLAEWFNQLRTELTGLHGGEALGEGWEWGQGQSVLRHINGEKYAGAQYAYFLGPVWAYDIFDSTFAKDTMSKEAGRRYRDGILKVGATQPAKKTLTEYFGREPNADAYDRWFRSEAPS